MKVYALWTICLFSLVLATAAEAEDWPQWRGADRNGISPETGLIEHWPDGGPPVRWKATGVGIGYGSPSVRDKVVYLLGGREDGQYVIALDESSGAEHWSWQIDEGYQNQFGDGPRSSPTVHGERVYALSAGGKLWCLRRSNGKPAWMVDLVTEFGGQVLRERFGGSANIVWGISESPLIEDGKVIVNSGGAGGAIVALAADSGKPVWRSSGLDEPPAYASAIAADIGGVRQIIAFTHDSTVGLNAASGALLWRYDGAANSTANCTTPVVSGDQVFLTSGYNTGCALVQIRRQGDAFTADQVYRNREMVNHHGGVVLLGDHVYGFSNQTLTCIRLADGETTWKNRSVGKGSLMAVDGKLICVGERGRIGLVAVDPAQYRLISEFSVEPRQGNLWAHPVVANGGLYIRNGDELTCYELRPAP